MESAMPHTTSWSRHGITWRFFGAVTTDEVNRANKEMYDDPRFDTITYFVWDMLNVEQLVKDEIECGEPAATDLGASFSNNHIRGALIAREGEVYDSCNSYIQQCRTLNNPWDLKLFTDNNSALAWLHS